MRNGRRPQLLAYKMWGNNALSTNVQQKHWVMIKNGMGRRWRFDASKCNNGHGALN